MSATDAVVIAERATPRSGPGGAAKVQDALYTIAHWLIRCARYRDAASVFRLMGLAEPTDERAWLGLGACHEALGQSDLALEMYGTGRAMAPSGARVEIARARLLDALERHDEAHDAWASARSKADGDPTLGDAAFATPTWEAAP